MSPEEETVINRNTMKLQNHLYKALKQRDQYKTERDTLIDDLSWYKAKVSRLEQIRDIKDSALKGADIKIKTLEQDLLRTEEFQDEIIQLEKDFENKHNLLSEISQHIGNKPSSSTYKYFRAKLDSIGIKANKNIEAPMKFIKRIAKEDE